MSGAAVAPVGHQQHANGVRLHYLRYAQGRHAARPVVIIVPGITSPAPTWGFVAERLATMFDTIVLDARGRGLSSASPDLDYSADAMAADLVALVAALELEHYAFVGHSMGARVAARAAAQRPRGLARLVLADPPVSGPGRRPYPSPLPGYLEAIGLAAHGCSGAALRRYTPDWSDEALALRAQWLPTCDARAVAAAHAGFHADDFHADLPRLSVATLLITAGRGDVVRAEDAAEILGLNACIAHRRMPNAGHMIPWDDADGFHASLVHFLDPAG